MLEQKKFSPALLIPLIQTLTDSKIKSLLIIYLLSQKDYLNQLTGVSVLSNIGNDEQHSPSRLNALVNSLDLSILTEAFIEKLDQEAVISILCSIPLFHQFKEEQVNALFKQFPEPKLISYWLNHYAIMPNAYFLLAYFYKLADQHVKSTLAKMSVAKKDLLISIVVAHLELYNPVPRSVLDQSTEIHLVLAIRLFLQGHNHASYITYIHQLADKLVAKNHPFSLPAVQLLISLNGRQEFTQLNNKTAYLTNRYMRTKALAGEVGLFYEADRINIISMTQPIQLKPTQPSNFVAKSVLGALLPEQTTLKTGDSKSQEAIVEVPENPLIEELAARDKPVKAFDYFIIHYHGNMDQLSRIITDYLAFYEEESKSDHRKKSVNHLCFLLTRKEIDSQVKQAIFNSLVNYPNLIDESNSYLLFQFDATQFIQHFGLKGGETNYNLVNNFCTWALSKLDPAQFKEQVAIAKKAQEEAQIELSFLQETGFFARLFSGFIRCWVYGWTGFFSPNSPIYVASAEVPVNDSVAVPVKPSGPPKLRQAAKNITSLLSVLEEAITVPTLDELIVAIKAYSLHYNPKDELELRAALFNFFQALGKNKGQENWYDKNESYIIANSFRLLEILLEKANAVGRQGYLDQINQQTNPLLPIVKELICPFPELNITNTIGTPAEPATNILTTTTNLLTKTWNLTSTGFFNLANLAAAATTLEPEGAAQTLK